MTKYYNILKNIFYLIANHVIRIDLLSQLILSRFQKIYVNDKIPGIIYQILSIINHPTNNVFITSLFIHHRIRYRFAVCYNFFFPFRFSSENRYLFTGQKSIIVN